MNKRSTRILSNHTNQSENVQTYDLVKNVKVKNIDVNSSVKRSSPFKVILNQNNSE